MGLGSGEQAEERGDVFIGAHVASFKAFRKKHRRWSKKSQPEPRAGTAVASVMSRYLAASRTFFDPAQISVLSLACDASRVSGKEIMLVVLLGTRHDGETHACWAPPQVIQVWGLGLNPNQIHICFCVIQSAQSIQVSYQIHTRTAGREKPAQN